ncbi:hypothetical protein V7332_30790, partial [Bacillus thuringiensis]|uniref:hypothetical protein n=1 Tax=Bacillus thuringiensis TaxID=1428 RepID=UPI00300359BD
VSNKVGIKKKLIFFMIYMDFNFIIAIVEIMTNGFPRNFFIFFMFLTSIALIILQQEVYDDQSVKHI